MAKANYVHDGPPPGIGFEAPDLTSPLTATEDVVESEVPDLLSQFDALDPADGYRLYSGGSHSRGQDEKGSSWSETEPLYYSWPWPESRLLHRNYRDNPVL